MSEDHTKINYEFLDSTKNFIYEARETGKTHSSFQYEIMLFYSIRNGDIDGVRKALDLYKESGLIINPEKFITGQLPPLLLPFTMQFLVAWMKVRLTS